LFAGLPALPVEDVLLQKAEEGLHRGVVGASPTLPMEASAPASARRSV
jgi:hypothetical protein